jgi:PEGA domain-containing protein
MKTRERLGLMAALLSGAFLLASCATMVKGTTQRVSISSDPPGAQVTIDNVSAGETPTTIALSCSSQHRVKIEKAGYLPHEETVSQSTSGWIAGNIIAGGLVGLCVDAATGGMYRLNPESISATLVKAAAPASPEGGQPGATRQLAPKRSAASVTAETVTHP